VRAAAHLAGMASSSSSQPTSRLERLLTIQELSDYLGVPVKTLYAWRAQRTGPRAVTVGRALRYPESAIVAWLEAQS
jgi:excisionase family DNA binding protein